MLCLFHKYGMYTAALSSLGGGGLLVLRLLLIVMMYSMCNCTPMGYEGQYENAFFLLSCDMYENAFFSHYHVIGTKTHFFYSHMIGAYNAYLRVV